MTFNFYGCAGYIVAGKLLCPSIYGLPTIINVCDKLAGGYDVTLNIRKTCNCYCTDNNETLRQVSLNGVKIPC